MIDLRLRFVDEAAAIAALEAFRGGDGWLTASHHHALDVIGALYAPPVLDDVGEVVAPGALLGGWHANLRLLDHPDADSVAAALEPYRVEPVNPAREWA